MRALTFNTWHGLSGHGLPAFGELEPAIRRNKRFRRQNIELQASRFDLLFLQELNPVDLRAQSLAADLGLDQCHAIDQSGIKILSIGLPTNLRSGLAILARPSLQLKLMDTLVLSGEGLVEPLFSFQLKERRIAICARAKSHLFGRLGLINCHLHHGPENTPAFLAGVEDLYYREEISNEQRVELLRQAEHAESRRSSEVEKILDFISAHESDFDSWLWAGDFNSSPQSDIHRRLLSRGFHDLALDLNCNELTWNPQANSDSHSFKGFHLPGPDFENPFVSHWLELYDQRPRRIDFLFAKGEIVPKLGEASASLWGQEMSDGLHLSDHFGLKVEWQR